MMKHTIKTLLALAAIGVATSASAISLIGFEPNKEGLPADVTFQGFADGPQGPFAISLPGATLEYNNSVIVQATGNGDGAVPFPSTEGFADDYLSIKTGGEATFSFSSPTSQSFGFQWGSIDAYNTIAFYLGGGLVDSFTGLDVVTSPVAANGNQGLNGSAYVTFGGGAYDSIVLSSSQNSFEIDNVSLVPDSGATLALLGLGIFGLAGARRFRK